MGKAIAGTAYLNVDGVTWLLRGDLEYASSTVERETVVGMDGIHGFTEKPSVGVIKGKFTDYGNFPISEVGQMRNVTITAELNNGKLIVGRNMWSIGKPSVNVTEGSFDVEWNGPIVQEVVTL